MIINKKRLILQSPRCHEVARRLFVTVLFTNQILNISSKNLVVYQKQRTFVD